MRLGNSSEFRHFEHGMLGVLLAGALCSSLVDLLMGWPEPESVADSRATYLIVLVLGAMTVAMLPVRQRRGNILKGVTLRVALMAAVAVPMALVLRRNSNTFYTAPSLIDGMIALLVLHLVSRLMRWIAVELRESFVVVKPIGAASPTTRSLRRILLAPQRPRTHKFTLPAVSLADGLASVSAWMLLAFWILVALERRHVASGALVFTATLLVLECAMLIPDTLAACGLLPRGLH